jgi:MOSC domain-containing protein YiiM
MNMGNGKIAEQERGTVTRILRYREKGKPGEILDSVILREAYGMEGDFHAGGGDRELCLFSAEARRWMDGQAGAGLCFSRFKENITVGGLSLEELKAGDRLRAGEAALEISGETKHCHDGCPLFQEGKPCRLAGRSLFAKVVKTGRLRVGDRMEREKRQQKKK